jgi:hypothetical protein
MRNFVASFGGYVETIKAKVSEIDRDDLWGIPIAHPKPITIGLSLCLNNEPSLTCLH